MRALIGKELALAAAVLVGQLLRVPAAGCSALLQLDPDVLGPDAFDLFFDLRTDIGRGDGGAKTFRRRDRLQAGNACADDEHFGRAHHAGRRHQHRKISIQFHRTQEHALVAGDVRHRRQCVHGLRARRPRDGIGRKGGDLSRGERTNGVEVSEGHQRADIDRPRLHPACFIASGRSEGRRTNFQDEIRAAEESSGIAFECNACVAVRRIRITGRIACARLDRDLIPGLNQLLARLGNDRNPPLA